MDLTDKATLFLYLVVGAGFVILVSLIVSGIDVWPGFHAVAPPSAGARGVGSFR